MFMRRPDAAGEGVGVVLSGKLVKAVTAATVPLVGVAALALPASASGTVAARGHVTCHYSADITFSPPLTPGAGSPGHSQEVITIKPGSLTGCTGTVTAGALPTAGKETKRLVVKIPAVVIGGVKKAGGCLPFSTLRWPTLKPTFTWTTTGVADAPSKATTHGATGIVSGTQTGYRYTGKVKGSFTPRVTIDAYFTPTSSTAIQACIGGSGSVASANFDPTLSTVSI